MDNSNQPIQHVAQESGIVLVLFAVVLFITVVILAMVVDHSKQSLSLDTLQRSADAAALSGAKRFTGTIIGWQEAKQAAVLALKQNPVLGIHPDQVAQLRLSEGPSAFNKHGSIHQGSIGKIGNLNVTVERGVLWHDNSLKAPKSGLFPDGKAGGYRFISLEGVDTEGVPIPPGLEGYLYSNAVRVTLQLDSLATSFGNVMGVLGFQNLRRSAIAVTHEDLEVTISGIAIPACALQVNDDPYATPDKQQLDFINFSAACARQGIAAEADPKRELQGFRGNFLERLHNDEIQRRREGLARFESYIRPFYAEYTPGEKGVSICYTGTKDGYRHNCKYIPLYGILGVPSTVPGETASAHQVAEAFANGVKASPGYYWASLESLRGFQINPSLADSVASSILRPKFSDRHNYSSTFYDEFTEGAQGDENVRMAKRNFPFIRNLRPSCGNPGPLDDLFDPERRPCIEDDLSTPALNEADFYHDLRIFWPTNYEIGGESVMGQILMDRRNLATSRQPLDYTNPMCHHPSIPIDSLNTTADPRRHTVRRMLAAVIAPGTKERPDGRPVSYCNAAELFAGYEGVETPSSTAAVPETHPVIIGFIPITSYDVGLHDLDANPAFQPVGNTNPFNYRVVDDKKITTDVTLPPPPNGWQRVASPRYSDPVSGETLVDRNPGELDVEGNFFTNRAKGYVKQYEEEHTDWEKCVEKTKTDCEDSRKDAPGGNFLGIPEEYLQCFDFRPVFQHPQFGNALRSIRGIKPDTCSSTNPLTQLTTSYPCITQAEAEADQVFGILQTHFEENIPALEFSHCIPRKDITDSNQVHDKNDPDFYVQPIDTTRAGFGCGGVLFKAACGSSDGIADNTLFLPGGVNWDSTTPALVAEDTP
jgi:hypothetical protein